MLITYYIMILFLHQPNDKGTVFPNEESEDTAVTNYVPFHPAGGWWSWDLSQLLDLLTPKTVS